MEPRKDIMFSSPRGCLRWTVCLLCWILFGIGDCCSAYEPWFQPPRYSKLTLAQRNRIKARENEKQEARRLLTTNAHAGSEKIAEIYRRDVEAFGEVHEETAKTIHYFYQTTLDERTLDTLPDLLLEEQKIYTQLYGPNDWRTASVQNEWNIIERLAKQENREIVSVYLKAKKDRQLAQYAAHPIQQADVDRATAAIDGFTNSLAAVGIPPNVNPELGRTYWLRARLHQNRGDYPASIDDARRAMAIIALEVRDGDRKLWGYGRQHPMYAQALSRLADTHWRMGRYPEATRLLRSAFDVLENCYDGPHAEKADVLKSLAAVTNHRGDAFQAEPIFARAVSMLSDSDDPSIADQADLLSALADCQMDVDKFEEALKTAQQAITLAAKIQQSDPLHYGRAKFSEGRAYHLLKNWEQSAQSFSQAARTYYKLRGKDDDIYGAASSFLGWSYFKMGRKDQAEPYLRGPVFLTLRRFGPNHGKVHDVTINYRMYLREQVIDQLGQADFDEALRSARTDLEICNQAYGQSSWLTIASKSQQASLEDLNKLPLETRQEVSSFKKKLLEAEIRYEDAEFREARRLAEMVVAELTLHLPNAKMEVARARCFLGLSACELGDHAAGVEQLVQSLSLFQDVYGKNLCLEAGMACAALTDSTAVLGNHAESDRWYESAEILLRRYKGPDTLPYAKLQLRRGRWLATRGRLVDAEMMLRDAFEILKRRVSASNSSYQESLSELAWTVARLGQFEEAEHLQAQVTSEELTSKTKTRQPGSPFRFAVQKAVVKYYRDQTEVNRATVVDLIGAPDFAAAPVPDRIFALSELAWLQRQSGQLIESDRYARRAISIAADHQLPTEDAYTIIENIGPELLRRALGDNQLPDALAAQTDFTRFVTLQYGDTHWRTKQAKLLLAELESLQNLSIDQQALVRDALVTEEKARAARREANFAMGLEQIELSLDLWKKIGRYPLLTDDAQRLQAELQAAVGDHVGARQTWQLLTSIDDQLEGSELRVSRKLIYAGYHDWDQGEFERAEASFFRSLQILQGLDDSVRIDRGRVRTGLALVCLLTGRLPEAQEYLHAAESDLLSLQVRYPDAYHRLLSAQMEFYLALNEMPHDVLTQFLAVSERQSDSETSSKARSAYLLGRVLSENASGPEREKHIENAVKLFRKSLELSQRSQGDQSLAAAQSMLKLAESLSLLKQFDEANAFAVKTQEILQGNPGRVRLIDAEILRVQATIAAAQNRPSNKLFDQSLQILRQCRATNTLTYLDVLVRSADTAWHSGEHDRARTRISEAVQRALELVDRVGLIQTEEQQLRLGLRLRPIMHRYLAWRTATQPADEMFDVVLRWKGMHLAHQLQLQHARQNPERKQLSMEWERSTERLVGVATRLPFPEEEAYWRRQVDDLNEQRNQLELQLLRMSDQPQACPTSDELSRLLPEETVLVDFLRINEWLSIDNEPDVDRKQRYLAFVLRRGETAQIVDLGDAKTIDQSILAWLAMSDEYVHVIHQQNGSPETQKALLTISQEFSQLTKRLRESLWSQLEVLVGQSHTVLISPDGELGAFPFGVLPDETGQSFLLAKHSIVQVLASRMLPEYLRSDAQPKVREPSVLLFGGIDFYAAPQQRAEAVPDLPLPQLQESSKMIAGSTELGSTMGFDMKPLEGTQREIDRLAELIAGIRPLANIEKISGDSATENAYRRGLTNHRWIHLATHGFFADAVQIQAHFRNRNITTDRGDVAPQRLRELPSIVTRADLTTGLAFAGANQANEADEDDGILWGMEVGAKDLSNVELIILSGCETARGRAIEGEGHLGMHRAFQIAGAKSVVSTLWSIADRPTSLFMQRFYRNLVRDGMSKAEALREAQIWFVHAAQEGAKSSNPPRDDAEFTPDSTMLPPSYMLPQYWAAFIINGDWR